ncbi:MAG: non-heme iron oxygenase ferredoxin subunit [Methyloligellaceae bacterium]
MSGAWHDVAATSEIEDEDVIQVKAGDQDLAVYNLGGRFFATTDVCSHAGACLSDGFVIGEEIECPLHQGRFHIPSGAARGAPASEPLAVYAVKVENGRVFVDVDGG